MNYTMALAGNPNSGKTTVGMMPITMVKRGETGRIKDIVGNDNIRRHLEHLGFVTGENITVVAEISGNLIVNVKDSRIALSKSMANKILV